VFILDRLPLINNYTRLEDEKEQICINNLITKVYESSPCPIVFVPILEPNKRINFILDNCV